MSGILQAMHYLMGDLTFVFTKVITSDTTNYNLRNDAIASGWNGELPLSAFITIASGIIVSANSTNVYAFYTNTSFPTGSTLKLVCAGYICGMGGAGGNGSSYGLASPGGAGGPALCVDSSIITTIDAKNGIIAGGGGGGGGGGSTSMAGGGGGGGGRSGRIISAYGYGTGGSNNGGAGGPAGGGGGGAGNGYGGYGGSGGNWGSNGSSGGYSGNPGGVGGAAGVAVVGNANIIWENTGTIYGNLT